MIPLRDTIRSRTTPFVNYSLIAANVLVFLLQLQVQRSLEEQATEEVASEVRALGMRADRRTLAQAIEERTQELYGEWLDRWALVPRDVVEKGTLAEYLAFLTCMFLHANWLHLLGNMLYLYIFGDNVEDRMGHTAYLLFYTGCGLAAAGCQFAIDPASPIPMVGASGAIAGALGGYLVLFPHSRVLTLVPIFYFIQLVEIPAPFFLLFWFLFQNLAPAALTPPELGGVAYWAHIGGFLSGAALCWILRDKLLRRPVDWRPPTTRRYTIVRRFDR